MCWDNREKSWRIKGRQAAVAIAMLLVYGPCCIAADGGIATAHPLATRAGVEVLLQGGNAFDAAVAVTAVLAVVEPQSSGLGGGGFYLLHQADSGTDSMLDAREVAPRAASAKMYLNADGTVDSDASLNGPLAAGIPGIPAALAYLAEEYGELPLSATLGEAIRIAERGFEVDQLFLQAAAFRSDALKASPAAAELFLDQGEPPGPGFRLVQKQLAWTLRRMVAYGAAGFYQGPVAEQLVSGVRSAGGLWSTEDLLNYRLAIREPVVLEYGDLRISSAALPSSGGLVIGEVLNILSGYPVADFGEIDRVHLIIEAMRRGYRDRAVYMGDADFVDVPKDRLLDPNYAAGLRASIRVDRATRSADLPGVELQNGGQDTTHFSIVDEYGNRVAATLSVNYPFGSGFVAPGTGVLLNNEMDDFSAAPGVANVYGLVGAGANAIAPGKRPLSSMSPTFVQKGTSIAVLGTPGGSRIISMVILAILDFVKGNSPFSWVSLPRYHHQYLPDRVQYETEAFSVTEVEELQRRGHSMQVLSSGYGNMQALLIESESGRVTAASDPRGRGLACVIAEGDRVRCVAAQDTVDANGVGL